MNVFFRCRILSGLVVLTTMLLPAVFWQGLESNLGAILLALLPASILSGASVPQAIRMVVNDAVQAGPATGRMAAINICGGVSGSVFI